MSEVIPADHRMGMRERLVVAGVVLLAFALRLRGLTERVMSHPENFVPGIDLPNFISYPPERLTAMSLVHGTLVDGHPPGYFIALFAWMKIFGTSLLAYRLPSAILGAASVWVLYLLARRLSGTRVAIVAAGMLALHGFHIYWSQQARMYTPVAFLGLVSTLWLVKAVEDGRLRSHVIYVLVTVTALWTQIYMWPVVAVQALWVASLLLRGARGAPAARMVALSFALGAPVVQLAIFQNPASRWHDPALEFFGFGYLYPSRLPYWGEVPWRPPALLLVGLCIALLVVAWRASRAPVGSASPAIDRPSDPIGASWLDWVLALGTSALMLLVALRWYGLDAKGVVLAGLPFLMVAIGRGAVRAFTRSDTTPMNGPVIMRGLPLALLLAVLPALAMLAVSAARGVWVQRGSIVFLPYLLLAVAIGLVAALESRQRLLRMAGVVAAIVVLAAWAASPRYSAAASSSPRDYESVAKALIERVQPGDQIIVRDGYGLQPFFYYLPRTYDDQLVQMPRYFDGRATERRLDVASAPVGQRFWLVRMCSFEYPDKSLAVLDVVEVVPSIGAELVLFTKPVTPRTAPWSWPARKGSLGCEKPVDLNAK